MSVFPGINFMIDIPFLQTNLGGAQLLDEGDNRDLRVTWIQ